MPPSWSLAASSIFSGVVSRLHLRVDHLERNAKADPPNTSFRAAPDRLIFRLMAALYPTQNTPDTS
jgi:hypothetical protein